MRKKLGLVIGGVACLAVAGVALIKYDVGAVAQFSDNILRPVIGNDNVIFLEKIFFNTSDRLQQLTAGEVKINPPQFNDGSGVSEQAGEIVLKNIPVDSAFKPLKDEGVWKIMDLKAFPNQAVMAYTFVRPDPARAYAIVTIAKMNMQVLGLGVVAGTKEPGGKLGNFGPGKIPQDIVSGDRLVAAFDGGFQYRDGAYGMIVDGKTYLPLQNDLGTVVGYKDGSVKIINYIGHDLGSGVAFVRQNCPILIQDGLLAVEDIKNKSLWGRTLTSDIYTWRTGIGIGKKGNLIFAVGNSLTPTTLAIALQMAGAQNAIQLDINPFWVRFNVFDSLGKGKYNSRPLTTGLTNGANGYLNGYTKDFFYVYKR